MLKPPPHTEVFEMPIATIWLDKEEGIYCGISKSGEQRTPEFMQKNIELFKDYIGDRKICILLDVTNASEISRETREFSAREFPKLFKAIAMMSNSSFGKMIANLFFTIKPQPYPTKMFTNEEEARAWLRQYL
ncbi:MAG: STAS/SEC14 domain-containing protein [Balneolales bacterium]